MSDIIVQDVVWNELREVVTIIGNNAGVVNLANVPTPIGLIVAILDEDGLNILVPGAYLNFILEVGEVDGDYVIMAAPAPSEDPGASMENYNPDVTKAMHRMIIENDLEPIMIGDMCETKFGTYSSDDPTGLVGFALFHYTPDEENDCVKVWGKVTINSNLPK